MNRNSEIEREAQRLVDIVRAELEHDTPMGPQWIVAEGERVLENAEAVVIAAQDNKHGILLAGGSLEEFLGVSWLGLCRVAHEQCERVQALL